MIIYQEINLLVFILITQILLFYGLMELKCMDLRQEADRIRTTIQRDLKIYAINLYRAVWQRGSNLTKKFKNLK